MNSKTKGNIGETKLIYELTKRGLQVSIPVGDNAPYDLVVEINNKLYKLQVKYSDEKEQNGSISSPICSKNLKIKSMKAYNKAKTYKDYIDLIAIYYKAWDEVVIIPFEEIKNNLNICFRKEKTKNNQSKNIHYIQDYTIDRLLEKISL